MGTGIVATTAATLPVQWPGLHGFATGVWVQAAPDAAFGGWLMPVVPPMVSAATGALLVPHLPAGQLRLTLLLACYAMFGLSLIASLVVITQLWRRLVRYSVGPAAMVPTLWIVLGPLGQSITAANLLGEVAHLALPAPYSTAFAAFGVVYGVPVWGFAALWAGLATALTVRAGRHQLPFGLTWWSFTFPVGTCVTGTSDLALHTGADAFRWAAVAPVSRARRRLDRGERADRPRRLARPPLSAAAAGYGGVAGTSLIELVLLPGPWCPAAGQRIRRGTPVRHRGRMPVTCPVPAEGWQHGIGRSVRAASDSGPGVAEERSGRLER